MSRTGNYPRRNLLLSEVTGHEWGSGVVGSEGVRLIRGVRSVRLRPRLLPRLSTGTPDLRCYCHWFYCHWSRNVRGVDLLTPTAALDGQLHEDGDEDDVEVPFGARFLGDPSLPVLRGQVCPVTVDPRRSPAPMASGNTLPVHTSHDLRGGSGWSPGRTDRTRSYPPS